MAVRLRHVVVVGGGPAGHRVADALLARDTDRAVTVTVVSEEPRAPYDRVALSRRFAGPVDLPLATAAQWDPTRVTVRTGTAAVAVDPATRIVTLDDGSTLRYDELVLATGSAPPIPDIPGKQHARVFRTIEDVDWMTAEVDRLAAQHGRAARVVVAGGGLLGLEAAGGLAARGADVAVVHSGRWLMSAQLDEGGGQALSRLVSLKGIALHLGHRPSAIETGADGAVTGVVLDDGRRVPADLVVVAIGIRPRDELAAPAGIERAPGGGIAIGADCRTSAPHVWAVGEVASFEGRCTGLVAPSNAMAEVVADRLLGGTRVFASVDDAASLKLADVDVATFGDAKGVTPGCLEVVYADPARGLHQKIVLSGDATTLLGGAFVGDSTPYATLRPRLGAELGADAAAFLSAPGAASPDSGELPDSALVCSCNTVTAGAIRDAVEEQGCTEMGPLKACTRAGVQCGSCVPLVRKLLEAELAKAGIESSHALCEHFDLSRQELFESVRVLGLPSFDAVRERFGRGLGCDICKPAIASILASQGTGHPLDGGRAGLQDTNDRALANMQRDGTYSVMPRIPGGEIDPVKLGVIAQVAQEYGLYTKISGGQRIDMFGARLEQLPAIWRRLVDAGFESGQAYGKALRTVKSCVGSTWCRYGVQDSTSMAIRLELRYRGLRAPHKFKSGVSGCARECAEARAKDFGVIATEQGWNLYVGGNGGYQPAHAQLLAGDLDDETLIRYVDRFLMYYIRTADRLQRTARWIEELPGGLDHVRDVVVHDSLGLAADLEAAMARHVDTYEDEWAATLADPDKLRRFRSFVNAADEPDPSLVRVAERGQLRPASADERAAGRAVPIADAVLAVRGRG
ncbi:MULTISPECIES: nitrite reductase large subunit NirB [Microbacterium]|uniref:nitrite reductase large subunit NirB n=1 Tax=Microbacterium TaxID=33882 RepID=UPI001D179380|nr:nitrite reductase large subunit NirB [Microbacterium testaceum]MCC4250684.1 nitrite reductase large subunit NirB [Microbacterium testaceum]